MIQPEVESSYPIRSGSLLIWFCKEKKGIDRYHDRLRHSKSSMVSTESRVLHSETCSKEYFVFLLNSGRHSVAASFGNCSVAGIAYWTFVDRWSYFRPNRLREYLFESECSLKKLRPNMQAIYCPAEVDSFEEVLHWRFMWFFMDFTFFPSFSPNIIMMRINSCYVELQLTNS